MVLIFRLCRFIRLGMGFRVWGIGIILAFGCSNPNERDNPTDPVHIYYDTRDGQEYRITTIGTQVWMAENLNYKISGSEDCERPYGCSYDWDAAVTVCPSGWHLPSKAEWDTLLSYVDSSNGCSKCAAFKLQAVRMWNRWDSYHDDSDNDQYGFSAVSHSGGNYGFWWSACEGKYNEAYALGMYNDHEHRWFSDEDKRNLNSVRCLQGNSSWVAPSCTAKNNTSTHYCSEGTMKEYGVLSDSRDNKTYKTVVIGTQTWMAENLNYNATASRCYGDSTGGDRQGNCAKYGRLYLWGVAKNSCPDGWHLPSMEEWEVLTAYIGGAGTGGLKLKATNGWEGTVDGNGGTDEYGFSALPGGTGDYSKGSFGGYDGWSGTGKHGYWWGVAGGSAYYRSIYFNYNDFWQQTDDTPGGSLYSVRCLKDNSNLPPPSSSSSIVPSSSSSVPSSSSVTPSSSSLIPSSSSSVPSSSSAVLSSSSIAQSYCYWPLSEYGGGCFEWTDSVSCEAGLGQMVSSCPIEYEGKTYKTVKIGTQTWMAENLNYNVNGSRCYGDNTGGDSQGNCDTYGRLYDWATAMNGAASSATVPSGVRGICPEGWHLPSKAEWEVMTAYINGESTEGKKLKATSGWNNNYYTGTSGNGTDEYGFSALPGGYGYSDGSLFYGVGDNGLWWNTSENNGAAGGVCGRCMFSDDTARWCNCDVSNLYSVRCLKN